MHFTVFLHEIEFLSFLSPALMKAIACERNRYLSHLWKAYFPEQTPSYTDKRSSSDTFTDTLTHLRTNVLAQVHTRTKLKVITNSHADMLASAKADAQKRTNICGC